jgi:hypothetical protein
MSFSSGSSWVLFVLKRVGTRAHNQRFRHEVIRIPSEQLRFEASPDLK